MANRKSGGTSFKKTQNGGKSGNKSGFRSGGNKSEHGGKGSWAARLRGAVRVRLVKGEPNFLINASAEREIELWDLAFAPDGGLTFSVSVPDFYRLRPLLRRSRGRTRIVARHGLPFQLVRLSRRKTFAAGMAMFAIALYLLSMLVWNVRVEGGSTIGEIRIREAAEAEGIHRFQWFFRLPDSALLADKLAARLPEAAWVGVKRNGTTITLTVIDSRVPEAKPLAGPSHLVAAEDAVVTRIIAESGRARVERHDRVRKGDVLISGLLGSGANVKAVQSKGKVMGLVWHELRIVSPMTLRTKGYTGAARERKYLIVGNRALQISGYGQERFDESRILATRENAVVGGRLLPLGILKERELEVAGSERLMTAAEAREEGLRRARAELLDKNGKDASIKAENILHEHTDNGKVVLTVLFEVEQSIGIERPIG